MSPKCGRGKGKECKVGISASLNLICQTFSVFHCVQGVSRLQVITPTKRLASQWVLSQSLTRTDTCFELPICMALTSWLSQLWQSCSFAYPDLPTLVTPIQSRLLWQRILTEDYEHSNIWPTSHSVYLAEQAFRFMIEWQIPSADLKAFAIGNGLCFMRWQLAYQQLLTQKGWLDPAQQYAFMTEHTEQFATLLPKELLCYGFDDFSPALLAWLDHLSVSGIRVTHESPPTVSSVCYSHFAENEMQELTQALAWADTQRSQQSSPWPIGIVVPNLTERRAEIVEACDAWFNTKHTLQFGEKPPRYFNVSGGLSLAKTPVIAAALECLSCLISKERSLVWSFLLATPFIAGGQTFLNQRMRARQFLLHESEEQPESALQGWTWIQDQLEPEDPLRTVFLNWSQWSETLHQEKPLSAWIPWWLTYLEAWGWPGERVLDSEEYQAVQQWFEVCTQLLACDVLDKRFDCQTALVILQQTLAEHCFQPQTYTDNVPIQILGILEAAGMQFDHLWVLGLSQYAWPEAANPNPFIPLALQKQHHLPHSSPVREMQFATKMLARLQHSANTVILSCPRQINRQPVAPSPLIEKANPTIWRQVPKEDPIGQALKQQTIQTVMLTDQSPPPLSIQGLEHYPSQVLSLQAQCAFKAFSQFRLRLKPRKTKSLGLSAAGRGNVVHSVLHQSLQYLKQHPQISTTSTDFSTQLQVICERIVQVERAKLRIPEFYWQVEMKRLQSIVQAVLETDTERVAFQLQGLEQRFQVTLNDLRFSLKCDRLDQDNHGNHWLIDYKTGECSPNDWLGEVPYDAQMPLYALSITPKPTVLCYYAIKPQGVFLSGISQTNTPHKGIHAMNDALAWDTLFQNWHTQLNTIAHHFKIGHAVVAPRQPERSCLYCHLKPLCRYELHE